jgi:hypothetical protein
MTSETVLGMKSDRLTLLAGLSLLLPPLVALVRGILLARDETTSLFYPIPGLVLLPLFFIGPLAIFVPMIFFFVWNAGLFNGEAKISKAYLCFARDCNAAESALVRGWLERRRNHARPPLQFFGPWNQHSLDHSSLVYVH